MLQQSREGKRSHQRQERECQRQVDERLALQGLGLRDSYFGQRRFANKRVAVAYFVNHHVRDGAASRDVLHELSNLFRDIVWSEIINPKSIRIYNKRNGVLQQLVIKTLSDDNNTINNEYIRLDKEGKITGVTHVTYNRRKK